jgi:sortase A
MEASRKESIFPSSHLLAFVTSFFLFWLYFQSTLLLRPPILPQPPLPPPALPATLSVPRINLQAPIIFSPSAEESTIQYYLRLGVVHLPQSALPGETGNSYIVGHSSDYLTSLGDYKTVFKDLPELTTGDIIIIQSGQQELEYRVTKTRIVAANDVSVLSQQTQGKKLLTLQTSYPIGTAQKRFIVVATLVKK